MNSLTAERLRLLLRYDPETGEFCWLSRPPNSRANKIFNAKYVGRIAGCVCPRGYRYIKIEQQFFSASRLAWLYMTGEWPKDEADHKDRDPSNNRFNNLREASRSQNGANRGVHKNSRSGVKGVYFSAHHRKWVSQAGGRGKRIVRMHESLEGATAAYQRDAAALFGSFARAA